ncbi:unnamed protein product [Closterium sp. NIES-54]
MVFPLRNKANVRGVLIPWIVATRHQLHEWFRRDLPVLQTHSDKSSEFSSSLLAAFCRDEGIVHSYTLAVSPQQNGIAERRIGLIMEVARTSMIHVAAPHFLWPFVVQYTHASAQPLAPRVLYNTRVSVPETSPTLRWTGEVGDASAFRVWGALSLVRDTTTSKLSPRTLRCAFLGFPTDAPPWQFYHPCSRRILSSQDVTIDESDCFYRLHPHASHPPLAVETSAAWGGDNGGEDAGGAGPGGAETGGEGSGGADSGGADFGGAASPSGGGAVGAPTAGPGAGQ